MPSSSAGVKRCFK